MHYAVILFHPDPPGALNKPDLVLLAAVNVNSYLSSYPCHTSTCAVVYKGNWNVCNLFVWLVGVTWWHFFLFQRGTKTLVRWSLYFSRKENLLKGRGVCATLHSMFLPLKCPFRERRSPASFSTKAVKLWRTDLGMGFPSIDWGHCTKERLSSPIRILTDDPSLLPHASQA